MIPLKETLLGYWKNMTPGQLDTFMSSFFYPLLLFLIIGFLTWFRKKLCRLALFVWRKFFPKKKIGEKIGAINEYLTLTPDFVVPAIGSPEEILNQAPEPRKIVTLTETAAHICNEVDKYFSGSGSGIREAYAIAQDAKINGTQNIAANKYLQVFNSIFSLFKNSPHCSVSEVSYVLSKFKENIKIVEESLGKAGACNQSEIKACENNILVIFGKFRV